MATKTLAAAAALLASSAIATQAFAADAGSARNWGGLWMGFGAGYAGTSSSGRGPSRGCLASNISNSTVGSASGCEVNDEYLNTYGVAGAVENGVGSTAEATVNVLRSESRVLTSAGAVVIGGEQVIGAVAFTRAGIPSSGSAATGGSAEIGDTGPKAVGGAAVSGSGTENVTTILTGGPSAAGKAEAFTIGTLNAATGAVASASYQAASVGSSWAEALAIGFDGIEGGDLSASDGGLSPEIHLRFDHQTESNWLFGAELSLSMPGGNGASGSDTATFGLSTEDYTSPDLSIRRSVTVDTTALASARLRLGYAMGDYMAYGTGGVAYARYTATSTTTGSFDGAQVSQSLDETDDAFGGVIGGGVSTFVADNATVSVEGLYYMFDSETRFGGGNGGSASLDNAFSVMTTFSIRAN